MTNVAPFEIGPGPSYLQGEIKRQLIKNELWSFMNFRSHGGSAIAADHPFLDDESHRIAAGNWKDCRERDWFQQCDISARQIYHRLIDLGAIDPNFSPRRRV